VLLRNIQSPDQAGTCTDTQESGQLSPKAEKIGEQSPLRGTTTVFDVLQSDRGLEGSELLAGSVFASDSEGEYVPLDIAASPLSGLSVEAPTLPRGSLIGHDMPGSALPPRAFDDEIEASHAIFLGLDEMDAERGAR